MAEEKKNFSSIKPTEKERERKRKNEKNRQNKSIVREIGSPLCRYIDDC